MYINLEVSIKSIKYLSTNKWTNLDPSRIRNWLGHQQRSLKYDGWAWLGHHEPQCLDLTMWYSTFWILTATATTLRWHQTCQAGKSPRKKNRSFEWENTRTQWGIFQQTMINIDKLCLITRRLLGIHPLARLISIHFAIFPPGIPWEWLGPPLFVAEVRPQSSASPRPRPTYKYQTANSDVRFVNRFLTFGNFTWDIKWCQWISMDINGYQVILKSLRTEQHMCFFDPTHLNQRGISLKIGMLWSG